MDRLPFLDSVARDIAAGDEDLDRGVRGPGRELAILRAAGLLRAPLAELSGGRGWGTSAPGAEPMLHILQALGGASLPIARIYEGHVNAARLVQRFGTASQIADFAAAVRDGAMAGVWGADDQTPVTIVRPSGATPCLAGAKAFASGLGDIAIAVVTARDGDGLQMVLVDVSDPSRADHGGWDVDAMVGSRSGRFDCSGIAVNVEHCLGQPGDLFIEPDFHGGLWRLCACYAGALAAAGRLLAARPGDWKSSDDRRTLHRVGEVAVEIETAALWARRACLAVECGAETAASAVCAALFAREAIEQVAQRALAHIERIGGTAIHHRRSRLGRIIRNLRFYLRQADLDGKFALATQYWLAECVFPKLGAVGSCTTRESQRLTDIAILYEHPTWFAPLFAALDRRGIAYVARKPEGDFDPAAASRPAPVGFNRIAMSAFLRDAEQPIFWANALLAQWERAGMRVLNGTAALAIDTSKARQLALLSSLGLAVPRTRVVHRIADVLAAADAVGYPLIVKANIGGAGAGIVRFDTREALRAAIADRALPVSIDGVLLVQDHVPARGGSITRIETLDRRYLYALDIAGAGAFDLCPADACAIAMTAAEPAPPLRAAAEAIATAAHLDVGGVEVMIDDRDGVARFYDINALSNFVARPLDVLGWDPHERLVDRLTAWIAEAR